MLPRTTAAGYFDHNALALVERLAPADGAPRMRLWQVRAKAVVLATGALERPLVFPGNDRPGVMLAGAAHQYLARYAVRPGRRAVVFTNNDDAYAAAAALAAVGAQVTVADVRAQPPSQVAALAEGSGLRLLAGAAVVRPHVTWRCAQRYRATGVRADGQRADRVASAPYYRSASGQLVG